MRITLLTYVFNTFVLLLSLTFLCDVYSNEFDGIAQWICCTCSHAGNVCINKRTNKHSDFSVIAIKTTPQRINHITEIINNSLWITRKSFVAWSVGLINPRCLLLMHVTVRASRTKYAQTKHTHFKFSLFPSHRK